MMKHMMYQQAIFVVSDYLIDCYIDKKEIQDIEKDVIDLYYLFHQRYVFTEDGLSEMVTYIFCNNSQRRKYEKQVFGNCPRYFCDMCPLLPVSFFLSFSLLDWIIIRIKVLLMRILKHRKSSILLYCPCCKEIYTPIKEDVAGNRIEFLLCCSN